MLPEDPWLLFRLRGRDQQGLLRNLRTQRSRSDNGHLNTPQNKGEGRRSGETGFYRATAAVEEEIPPLEAQITNFWGSGKAQQDFRPHILAPTVELALLRRLGLPPLGSASSSTYDALSALYRRISHAALDLAYAGDGSESDASQGNENGHHNNGHSNGNGNHTHNLNGTS